MKKMRIATVLSLILLSATSITGQETELYKGFKNPEKEYYPRVWWHWMHGNVTKDGIKKDLEWMDRAGIAGFHQFNCQLRPTDVIVKERVTLFSKEWDEAFSYALDVADSLGLEVSIASSPGWSVTGGPWVKPEDSQKKITWICKDVTGGKRVISPLPEPYTFAGPLQDKVEFPDDKYKYQYYKDIAVLAIRKEAVQNSPKIEDWIQKIGFEVDNRKVLHSPAASNTEGIARKDIIDISHFCKNGEINWNCSEGEWTIYRFGYNLLGRMNGPVERAGKGLEVDKLNPETMERYYRDYLSIFDKVSGHRLGTTIKYVMIDSYEAGKGTWTPKMREEFSKRRGYDLTPWLPVLTGLVVEDLEKSESFLGDWRKTLGELITENHYDLPAKILAEYGLKTHIESQEGYTGFIGDGMMPKRSAAVPMGAIWVKFNEGWYAQNYVSKADIRESAAAAHIYGGNICAAESFSVNSRPTVKGYFPAYQCSPANLKRLADAALSQGLNRFIMHCSPHQPEDDKFPGLGLGSFGNWFTRHDTWAEEARPWHDYLARSCYMMQQGRFVADVAFLYNEDMNACASFGSRNIPAPASYGFDLINQDVLCNYLEIKDGKISNGKTCSYSLLMIDPEYRYMSVEVLEKLKKAADEGVQIIGHRPEGRLKLSDSEKKFDRLVSQIWDRGRGNVHETADAKDILTAKGISPDCIVEEKEGTDFYQVHRQMDGTDIYWVANISPVACDANVSFRMTGRKPMQWNAEDGSMQELSYTMHDGRTDVSLHFNQDDSHFIVFADEIDCMTYTIEKQNLTSKEEVKGPWKIEFQPGRDAPESTVFETCGSYTESKIDSVKYFSGTAVWNTEFNFDPSTGKDYILDLGRVEVMARVKINGKDLGLLWKAPYRVSIGKYLKSGQNRLEIAITNLWPNRMIGDSFKPKEKRLTYTPWQFYERDSELIPSGLLGPVSIEGYE